MKIGEPKMDKMDVTTPETGKDEIITAELKEIMGKEGHLTYMIDRLTEEIGLAMENNQHDGYDILNNLKEKLEEESDEIGKKIQKMNM